MFVAMGVVALALFGDLRAGLVGGAYSAVLSYLWVRPGGFGYRIEAHQQRVLEEHGDVGVRPRWLFKALVLVLLVLAASAAIIHLVTSWGSGDDTAPTPTAAATDPEPVVGFDFSGALVPGLDRSATPPVVVVPECFGGATRIALVGEDLEATAWEVVPIDAENPPMLDRVSLGIAPDGFETSVPLAEGTSLMGVLVVNGPDNLALLAITEGGSGAEPGGCE